MDRSRIARAASERAERCVQADGNVYISRMNVGQMGKLLGGTLARGMDGSVAQDGHAMLAALVVRN